MFDSFYYYQLLTINCQLSTVNLTVKCHGSTFRCVAHRWSIFVWDGW
ncbi:MAG: hypothetical protein HC786_30795 [Richelia sp. CSU_2_1]|nr:hypothetical protein [Microcoleus sp. SU_5_6]NJR26177.1 hypothetical protein [Richelia sp. CSU_2_1]